MLCAIISPRTPMINCICFWGAAKRSSRKDCDEGGKMLHLHLWLSQHVRTVLQCVEEMGVFGNVKVLFGMFLPLGPNVCSWGTIDFTKNYASAIEPFISTDRIVLVNTHRPFDLWVFYWTLMEQKEPLGLPSKGMEKTKTRQSQTNLYLFLFWLICGVQSSFCPKCRKTRRCAQEGRNASFQSCRLISWANLFHLIHR